MDKRTGIKIASKLALFGASVIWGSSFLVVKNSMDSMQPHTLLALRFTIGSIILCAIFIKRLKYIDKDYIIKGGIIGILLFIAYSLQTIGITDTTPGKNAFLTAIYCVIVPFLYWIIERNRPDRYNIAAAILCLTGIGLVSLKSGFKIRFGDAFTLISGFFYAAHMVALSRLSKDKDPVLLTIVQFGYTAIISLIIAIFFEDIPGSWSYGTVLGIMYLAVFATAVALLLQTIGQKYTKPAPASIILSLEAVFGVIFSVIFYGEELSFKLVFGFILIFISIITSETKWSFLKKK